MTRRVLYVAHPLAPTEDEIARFADAGFSEVGAARAALRRNIDLALRWLAWLRRSFSQDTFIAPWIASVLSGGDDDDPKQREAGLADDCAVVERCDGIVLCGFRISSGMQREREHGVGQQQFPLFEVFDLTRLAGREPPQDLKPDDDLLALDAWYATWVVP